MRGNGYGKYGYGYGGYGGYGYGGYGYAAYDTSAAYAYYANDEDDIQPSEGGDSTTVVTPRKRRSLQPSSKKAPPNLSKPASASARESPGLNTRGCVPARERVRWGARRG